MRYSAPGVYIEEIDSGPRPISAVGTETAGFIGTAPRADAAINEAIAINNWSEFLRRYAGDGLASTDLANAVQGFFLNGGSRCYIANIPEGAPIAGKGLDALNLVDEIAMIAAPGRTDFSSHEALVSAAASLKDRVAILDGPAQVDDIARLTQVGSVESEPASGGDEGGEGTGGGRRSRAKAGGLRPPMDDKGYGAFYFPWLRARDALDPAKIVSVPPSGHMAGIFARTDAERGVHKAPANLPIRGALGLTQMLSQAEQGLLNDAGVNCIRFFTREGIRIWGARTIAPAESNWRYLNVRRLFAMIEESIAISTRWVVFEPNDRPLWKAIERDVGAFLTLLWRQGALAGAKPEQAFFVRCNEETNPPEVIDAGQVVVLVGIAPVKPAEFVIFRIGQSPTGTMVEGN
ncbi:hypothetical protein GCM10007973_08620 [Polymorphobacter multimanifer]|uniref:Phage tail sheath family protein n=1 Tax=Polymorphobacter multimanifer TaxID=1070431 RepID=A0A841L6M3_9SPHN|nr:phage tail sheath C-terminal domain-containing protein [Polymorphobacter multimanifer]MBB6228070.1 hypothetical protein [Polymorphobacter multimanifer]GGI74043.1 hypothetical protein GCM10007973_08620 [Polymorphobacter multimanifer]